MTSALGSGKGEAGWNWRDPQHHLASRNEGMVPHRHLPDPAGDLGRGLPEYGAADSNQGLHANEQAGAEEQATQASAVGADEGDGHIPGKILAVRDQFGQCGPPLRQCQQTGC